MPKGIFSGVPARLPQCIAVLDRDQGDKRKFPSGIARLNVYDIDMPGNPAARILAVEFDADVAIAPGADALRRIISKGERLVLRLMV